MATELKLFKANVTFTFKGDVQVCAEDKEQAQRLLEAEFAMVNNGGVHTTIDDEEIDWDFPVHPDKKITNLRKA
jgi:hypothetical protein